MSTKTMPDYAGLRSYAKARSTGTHVGIYDGEEAGMDTEGGRWQTVCEEHATICSHQTLALARSHASCPEGWCETCIKQTAFDEKAAHAYQLGSIDAYAERPIRDMDGDDSAWLMTELGETKATDEDNWADRAAWCDAYFDGFSAAAGAMSSGR